MSRAPHAGTRKNRAPFSGRAVSRCFDAAWGENVDAGWASARYRADALLCGCVRSGVDRGRIFSNGRVVDNAGVERLVGDVAFERRLELVGRAVQVEERVESQCDVDRPIGWTQHVTLGPPFLEKGLTEFRAPARRSRTYEGQFGVADYLVPAANFDWPAAPRAGGGTADMRRFTDAAVSSAYTAHLITADADPAFFVAFSPRAELAFGYAWHAADFPWLGIWEENCSRTAAPWNGRTVARGMEFGVSPFPESRRAMVDRARLFDVPTFRWLPARRRLTARYAIVMESADRVPESLGWPAREGVRVER